MGRVGDLRIDNPREVAERVVERWRGKVFSDAEAMGDKYLRRIQSADTERMRRLLAEWYENGLPQFTSAIREIWRGAPAPIRR